MPKKVEYDLREIEKLAGFGLTDAEIGDFYGVTEMTVNRWKQKPEFLLALKRGKIRSDSKIVESLYHRASGYEHEDTVFFNFKGKIIFKKYIKHYAPDTIACIYWLNNRMKDRWRNKTEGQDLTDAEIAALRVEASRLMTQRV